MNLPWFEVSDVRLEQPDVPLDDVDAALTARLCDVPCGAIGKGRPRMCLSRELALHSSDFDLQSVLSFFLGYRADAQADPNPEVSLVNESSAVGKDGDAWSACRGHGLLL
jgi:hypothetical protein